MKGSLLFSVLTFFLMVGSIGAAEEPAVVQRLPNGNTIVTNVQHGKHSLGLEGGVAPKAFEVTADKKVVWKVPASTSSYNMGSIQILDVPEISFKMDIYR